MESELAKTLRAMKEDLESVMPKTIKWLRAIAPQQSDPIHAARILIASDTIERLQGLNTDLELLAKKRATLLEQATQERDAALALEACEDLRLKLVAIDKRLDTIEAKLDKALAETLMAAFRQWKIGHDALGGTKS